MDLITTLRKTISSGSYIVADISFICNKLFIISNKIRALGENLKFYLSSCGLLVVASCSEVVGLKISSML